MKGEVIITGQEMGIFKAIIRVKSDGKTRIFWAKPTPKEMGRRKLKLEVTSSKANSLSIVVQPDGREIIAFDFSGLPKVGKEKEIKGKIRASGDLVPWGCSFKMKKL